MIHILFWNPDISSMTRDRMTDEMTEILNEGGYFNWSFWEYENVGKVTFVIWLDAVMNQDLMELC